MHIREHRGFNIQVYESGNGYVLEIYRKGKLIHTAYNENGQNGRFHSPALVIEAARNWINCTYPHGRIKYFGEV